VVENALHIYTDGSSFNSPRRGGVGMRFIQVDDRGTETMQDWCPPGYESATNNQMELQACILALREAKRLNLAAGLNRIVIHTDSQYVSENLRSALYYWPREKWLKRDGAPVLNVELWKDLTKAVKSAGCPVDIEWVKGHSKDPHNKAVDKLARKSAGTPLNPSMRPVNVRRKMSTEKAHAGSVGMDGQRLTIRVISDELLNEQKLYRFRYEVVSKASSYCGKVDHICCTELLKAGHVYHVRVNK